MKQSLRVNSPLFFILLLYIACCYGITSVNNLSGEYSPLIYLDAAIKFTVVLAFLYFIYWCLKAYYIIIFVRPEKLGHYLKDKLLTGPFHKKRFIQALPIFIILIPFISSFTTMKMLIPHINAFSWDEQFAALDKALHFGFDPWTILMPVLGYYPLTFMINFVYILWLGILFFVLYWQLFSLKDPQLRMQFFISFLLTWGILGTFLAIYFSSGGPCYFLEITGSTRFEPLMEYLNRANEHYPIWALNTQDLLWSDYTSSNYVVGSGISAMPSIHVATATLYVLLCWNQGKILKTLSIIFFAFIMIGSVHLAWHYAADGYLAIALTLPLWFLSGKISSFIYKDADNKATD
jgi:hypothetical protein